MLLVPVFNRAAAAEPEGLRGEVERFLATCRRPAVIEPGADPILPERDALILRVAGGQLRIEAWDKSHILHRRILRIRDRRPGRLELVTERLGGKQATLRLVDMERASTRSALIGASREVFKEHFAVWLSRQFPGWRISDLSTGADLEHTLSPAFPRALLSRGARQWAALASPNEPGKAGEALTFGLIWLDYLRRERRGRVEGLALFLPQGTEAATLLRLQGLDPNAAQWAVYCFDETGIEEPVNISDCGNLINDLEPWSAPQAGRDPRTATLMRHIERLEGVECIDLGGGSRSYRVRGLEFARLASGRLEMTIGARTPIGDLEAVESHVRELARRRDRDAPGLHDEWRNSQPERWLESTVRAGIQTLRADLEPAPVYGQVIATAGRDRGIVDLLAIDRTGRLAAIELKASEDPHLPVQGLDYWLRLRWHAARGELETRGYFPGKTVLRTPPRLLLVAPALCFHATSDIVLSYFSPDIEVERIGLGVEWQVKARVVLRVAGNRRVTSE